MAGGEVDLLLATMLFDGRYQDACWIMRTTYSWYLDDAAEWYVKYHKALKHHDEAKENKIDQAVSDKEILALYGFSVNELLDKYNTSMNQINRGVLHRNPGLLNRLVLIFPKK
jgi:glucan phosphorylase